MPKSSQPLRGGARRHAPLADKDLWAGVRGCLARCILALQALRSLAQEEDEDSSGAAAVGPTFGFQGSGGIYVPTSAVAMGISCMLAMLFGILLGWMIRGRRSGRRDAESGTSASCATWSCSGPKGASGC